MTDEERAVASEKIGEKVIELIGRELKALGGTDGDMLSVGASVGVGVAVSFAAMRAVDRRAAVALVTCIAEAVAEDIYG